MTKKEKAYIKSKIAQYRKLADEEFAKAQRETDRTARDEAYTIGQRYDDASDTVQMLLTELEALNIK